MWGISKDICLRTMRVKIQMTSFDNGHSADMAYLPHVGSSSKHFLRQSDWYVLCTFLHMEYDVGATIWVSNSGWLPLILIYLCCRSGRCYTETVSALIVCVSDPSRHWALLLFVTALASSWRMAAHCTDPLKTHVDAVSPTLWISTGLQRLVITCAPFDFYIQNCGTCILYMKRPEGCF